MPYSYSKKQVILSQVLEIASAFLLFPLWIFQRPQRNIRKILLVEPFQMGDVLSLTPLIDPLLQRYPNVELYILTKPSSGAILELDARIKAVIKIDFPWSDYGFKKHQISRILKSIRQIIRLRSFQFDLAVDTRGDIRSQVIMLLAGSRERVGYQNYLHSNVTNRGWLLTKKELRSKHVHRYKWNMELLRLLDIPTNSLLPLKFPSFHPKTENLDTQLKVSSVIHIGGGWEYKRWSEAKWEALITQLANQQLGVVAVIAGPGERDIIDRLEKNCISDVLLEKLFFKVTTLVEMVGLLQQCSLFVGLDSGPMNLAVCLNKRVIALFGPGDSDMWQPLSEGSRHIHKKENFPCNPCRQIVCYFAEKNCMAVIDVNEVLKIKTH